MILRLLLSLAILLNASGHGADVKLPAKSFQGSPYLFVWSGDAEHKTSDFLSVIDVNPSSASYGQIVSTLPVGVSGIMPHHTEYEFPAGNMLFAEGWVGGRTFVFDLNQPLKPRIAAQFTDRGGYIFPHSFARLPNGNVLATFQSHGEGYAPGGGLVELDPSGTVVRSASAVDPAVSKDVIWPYSLAIAPKLDLAISSCTPMGWPEWANVPAGSWDRKRIDDLVTSHVQLWRLSSLQLISTVTLPDDPEGKHNRWPAEPRILPDNTVYVNTFTCGLYRLKNLDSPHPSADKVYAFPGGDTMHTMCSVPVVVGHYWVQTVAALPGLIVLDVSHPEKPVEVSRLKLDERFHMPHWIATDRKGDRLVITGDDQSWLVIARLDTATGAIALDENFRQPGATDPGISFDRKEWPHGLSGRAVVHGALFGPL